MTNLYTKLGKGVIFLSLITAIYLVFSTKAVSTCIAKASSLMKTDTVSTQQTKEERRVAFCAADNQLYGAIQSCLAQAKKKSMLDAWLIGARYPNSAYLKNFIRTHNDTCVDSQIREF